MDENLKASVLATYGAQLGELAWHAIHVDDSLIEMSNRHAQSIVDIFGHFLRPVVDRKPRILEIGAYAHFSAARAAEILDGIAVSHDISPPSLRLGKEAAGQAGVRADVTLVAGDFHDLPFCDDYFDIVFCASCIHHTFRPWHVIAEMLRVTRPGGIMHLQNEPVGRSAGFYLFRSNRPETFTQIEQRMDERGSIAMFSSPFFGSRREHLFGMIENDRMPLELLTSALNNGGTIINRSFDLKVFSFDQSLIDIKASLFMEADIAKALIKERDTLMPYLTLDAQRAGIRLPTDDEIWLKAYAMAPSLRQISKTINPESRKEEIARTFGASMVATVRKSGISSASDTLFRRHVNNADGVAIDLPEINGVFIDFNNKQLPDITSSNDVEKAYPSSDWLIHMEENGYYSALNLKVSSDILLTKFDVETVILIRFYGVHAPNEPYSVDISLYDGTITASIDIVQSESRLVKCILPAYTSQVSVSTRSPRGPTLRQHHVRLGIVRLLPIWLTAG